MKLLALLLMGTSFLPTPAPRGIDGGGGSHGIAQPAPPPARECHTSCREVGADCERTCGADVNCVNTCRTRVTACDAMCGANHGGPR